MARDESVRIAGVGRWFPSLPDDRVENSEWRLDIITLLAVIGESSMAEHSQTITSSALCLLPRILPAPQALLKPVRPHRMPSTAAKVTGVKSGVALDSVAFFANIIIKLDDIKPFEFRVINIRHKDEANAAGDIVVNRSPSHGSPSAMDYVRRLFRLGRKNTGASQGGAAGHGMLGRRPPSLEAEDSSATAIGPRPSAARSTGRSVTFKGSTDADVDPEKGGAGPPHHHQLRRRPTAKDKMTDFIANPTLATLRERPAIPAKLWSPIHVLGIFSMLVTVALLVMAWYWTDGPAMLAVSMIGLQSSIVGWASWWRPVLMKRTHTNRVPEGDVMIRTREGAFILVRCSEEVGRELFSTAECDYRIKDSRVYRLLMGLGTVILMVSTVLLGNCSWNMQLFVGTSYIILNALYWALSMLPPSDFWDLGRYDWKWATPDDAADAHGSLLDDDHLSKYDQREGVPSFTRTLWYAIRETGVTGWAERGGAAPTTPPWQQWLAEAEAAVGAGNREWPAVSRKDEILKEYLVKTSAPRATAEPPLQDPGKQHAPATEVQLPIDGTC
ncbi:hypothetical protein RB594_002083 [Gaeumannomyces avenae]